MRPDSCASTLERVARDFLPEGWTVSVWHDPATEDFVMSVAKGSGRGIRCARGTISGKAIALANGNRDIFERAVELGQYLAWQAEREGQLVVGIAGKLQSRIRRVRAAA